MKNTKEEIIKGKKNKNLHIISPPIFSGNGKERLWQAEKKQKERGGRVLIRFSHWEMLPCI